MYRASAWLVFGFLLACGCATVDPPVQPNGKPDPFLDEIASEAPLEKKPGFATLKSDAVLKEVPLQTPLAQAQATMERHGFACWSGVPEGDTLHLRCTAYKKRPDGRFDRVLVKCYYEHKRVTSIAVQVEYGVRHTF